MAVPDDITIKWNKWIEDVNSVSEIGWKRCIVDIDNYGKTRDFELYTFTDASKHAYAAVVYLKVYNETSNAVNLLFAKTRIAPINEISIPRLELLGVLIGCRLSKFVAKQLDIPDIKQTIFTDSMCVIEWCKSDKPKKRFVQDKIKEIQLHDIKIGYVKSEENPADIASRGISVQNLLLNHLWWEGPWWLKSIKNIQEGTKFRYCS